MNLISTTKQLISSRFVQFISFIILTFPFLALYRYKSGLNYLPLHIEVDGQANVVQEVWCQSQFGNWGKIEVDNRYPNRWRQHEIVSGVRRLCIVKGSHLLKEHPKLTIKKGESWKIADQVPFEIVTPTAEILNQFPQAAYVVDFTYPVTSKLNAARNTVNWQGDLLLLFVPFCQSVLFAAIIFSPIITLMPQTLLKKDN